MNEYLIDRPTNQPASTEEPLFDALELMKEGSSQVTRIGSWKTLLFVIPTKTYGSGFFVDSGNKNRCVVATDTHVIHAFPSVTLKNGSSYSASVLGANERKEMTYLELRGVPDPEKTCKGVKLAAAGNTFTNESDVNLVGYPGADRGTQRTLGGKSLPTGLHRRWFSSGLFSSAKELTIAAFDIPGAGPGTSGAPIFDANGAVIAIVAGGDKYTYAKPIDSDSVHSDIQSSIKSK